MSDDGRFAVVAIALVGSPFSSAYARAGKDPLRYSALNVALYGPERTSWSLTERAIAPGDRARDGIRIGASEMRWEGDTLVVDVDERCAPFGRALRGTLRFHPTVLTNERVSLDPAHAWWPAAPAGRIEVDLDGARFSGHGYHDANAGDEPLARAFAEWSWSRARARRGALLAYDVVRSDGTMDRRAITVDPGGVSLHEGAPLRPLPRTRWGLTRHARGERVAVLRELEDTPFYSRSLVESVVDGERLAMMHETMSCARLAAPWVRFLVPFRTRRA